MRCEISISFFFFHAPYGNVSFMLINVLIPNKGLLNRIHIWHLATGEYSSIKQLAEMYRVMHQIPVKSYFRCRDPEYATRAAEVNQISLRKKKKKNNGQVTRYFCFFFFFATSSPGRRQPSVECPYADVFFEIEAFTHPTLSRGDVALLPVRSSPENEPRPARANRVSKR